MRYFSKVRPYIQQKRLSEFSIRFVRTLGSSEELKARTNRIEESLSGFKLFLFFFFFFTERSHLLLLAISWKVSIRQFKPFVSLSQTRLCNVPLFSVRSFFMCIFPLAFRYVPHVNVPLLQVNHGALCCLSRGLVRDAVTSSVR